MPVGIGYISASLKRAGHDVIVANSNHSAEPVTTLIEREILEHNPRIVATGGMAFHVTAIREITDAARAAAPNATIVIGGLLVTNGPEVAMAAVPEADIGVIGEGEHTVVELAAALEAATALDDIKGLVFRTGSTKELKRTAPRPVEQELDSLPWVDWEGLGLDVFAGLHGVNEMAPGLILDARTRAMPLLTSRGCPYACTFCCHEGAGRGYRVRSLDDVFAELTFAVERWNINAIFIYDELFCLQRKRLEEFCKRIAPMGMRWACSLRVEQIEPDTLALMRRSGCCCVSIGFESASPTVLMSMNKSATADQLRRAMDLIYQEQMLPWANLIFGDPAETLETAKESLNWMADNSHFNVRTALVGYHPGSRIYEDALKRKLIADPVQYLIDGKPEINGTAMSAEDFTKMRTEVALYSTVFGLPGRLVELKQIEGSVFAAVTSICPHCDIEDSRGKVRLWHSGALNSVTCHNCNRSYRLPISFRKKATAELKQCSAMLREIEVKKENQDKIIAVCRQIISLDASDDLPWYYLALLADVMRNSQLALDAMRNAILRNPYSLALCEQMATLLSTFGFAEESTRYARKALQLRRMGIQTTHFLLVA